MIYNVKLSVEGDILTIKIDLTENSGAGARNIIVASTGKWIETFGMTSGCSFESSAGGSTRRGTKRRHGREYERATNASLNPLDRQEGVK